MLNFANRYINHKSDSSRIVKTYLQVKALNAHVCPQFLAMLNRQNKQWLIMGDFNLHFLKYENHTGTEEFMNNLGMYCFQPHILQPTQTTDHTATLTIISFIMPWSILHQVAI